MPGLRLLLRMSRTYAFVAEATCRRRIGTVKAVTVRTDDATSLHVGVVGDGFRRLDVVRRTGLR